MLFQDLGLQPALLRALKPLGYRTTTPVQEAAIPPVLRGRDVMAGAPTGTGKTAAFALPVLERLFPEGAAARTARSGRPRALVLTPTRELAAQIHASFRDYAKYLPMRSTVIFGGVNMNPQLKALAHGLDVVIATPGRLIDHLEHGSVDLGGIEILVLDEADRMLDMGFRPALRKIVAHLPAARQTLMFSATFSGPVTELAAHFVHDPARVQVAPPNVVVATVSHRVVPVDAERKRELLLHLLEEQPGRQTLVFGRTKHGVDKLVRGLLKAGVQAAAIHGNKSQNQRTRALQDFKDHKIAVLVATDIAARGLDIEQLPLVINYDLPMVAEDYVHRIGRTGRAGADGLAVSLVSQEETGLLRDIQKILKDPLRLQPEPGFEPAQPLRLNLDLRPQQKPRPARREARGGAQARGPRHGEGRRPAQAHAGAAQTKPAQHRRNHRSRRRHGAPA